MNSQLVWMARNSWNDCWFHNCNRSHDSKQLWVDVDFQFRSIDAAIVHWRCSSWHSEIASDRQSQSVSGGCLWTTQTLKKEIRKGWILLRLDCGRLCRGRAVVLCMLLVCCERGECRWRAQETKHRTHDLELAFAARWLFSLCQLESLLNLTGSNRRSRYWRRGALEFRA